MPVARTQRTRHHGLLRSPQREVTCSCPEHHKAPRKCDSVRRRGIVSLPRLLRGPCTPSCVPAAWPHRAHTSTARKAAREPGHPSGHSHTALTGLIAPWAGQHRPAPCRTKRPPRDKSPPHDEAFIPQAITASASSQAHIEKHQHTHLYYPWRISNDECRSVS